MNFPDKYKWLRRFGSAEAISFLLLLGVAMPLKYFAGMPMAVRVVGAAHGILFILYAVAVLAAARQWRWPAGRIGFALGAALLPFGPFWFDARLRREEDKSEFRNYSVR